MELLAVIAKLVIVCSALKIRKFVPVAVIDLDLIRQVYAWPANKLDVKFAHKTIVFVLYVRMDMPLLGEYANCAMVTLL